MIDGGIAPKRNQATDRVHRLGQRRGVKYLNLLPKYHREHIHSIIKRKTKY